jgi:hypothetical protein
MKYGTQILAAWLAAAVFTAGNAWAGSLNPTSAPGPTMHTLEDVYRVLTGAASEAKVGLNNTNAPASTMHDLAAIYQAAVAAANGAVGPKVFRTGVTVTNYPGDDGYYQKGAAWPDPVFTEGTGSASNCVTDNRTGLMWLKNPSGTARIWGDALAYCENLDGSAGRGGYTDWRMPNFNEMVSLFDFGVVHTTGVGLLPEGHPLLGPSLGQEKVWCSTSVPWSPSTLCWIFNTGECLVSFGGGKSQADTYVWPVRGGN